MYKSYYRHKTTVGRTLLSAIADNMRVVLSVSPYFGLSELSIIAVE